MPMIKLQNFVVSSSLDIALASVYLSTELAHCRTELYHQVTCFRQCLPDLSRVGEQSLSYVTSAKQCKNKSNVLFFHWTDVTFCFLIIQTHSQGNLIQSRARNNIHVTSQLHIHYSNQFSLSLNTSGCLGLNIWHYGNLL